MTDVQITSHKDIRLIDGIYVTFDETGQKYSSHIDYTEARNTIDSYNKSLNAEHFSDLQEHVVEWGWAKNILPAYDKGEKQCLKFISEAGEVADGIATDNQLEVADGIGDVLVTLILLAEIRGLTLQQCLQLAYDIISKRTGETKNGVFIKNE